MKAVVMVAVCVVAAVAAPQNNQGYGYQPPSSQYGDGPAQYSFQWEVNDVDSGNQYGHQEQREGDNTQGSYYVQLPDSRLLKVEYYVDEQGYHPTITYEGEATYPSQPSGGYSLPEKSGRYDG